MLERLAITEYDTRLQYVLMVLFGAACIAVALVPDGTLPPDARVPLMTLFFGLTGGLWLGHLVAVLHRAVNSATSPR
jgi:hypothetical protein